MEGRGDGWFACERLLFKRAAEKGPEVEELITELLM